MAYPHATADDVDFFAEHGWIVVTDAVDPADLAVLEDRCNTILDKRDTLAFDWAWEEGTERDQRDFRILQSSPTIFYPELNDARFRSWAIEFASTLMGQPVEFWYDQFLAKPPDISVPTRWHQDEAYWGRALDDVGITCWMPMHDVDVSNGCMHFIDGGHRDGVLEHHGVPGVKSDLICCDPDESRTVACPISLGSVTFHHGKTPHMTPANTTDSWRRILTQHLRVEGTPGEGDHYPWKVYVNQFTGERTQPRGAMSAAAGECFLGLDFGTESVRALLVDGGGTIVATAVAPYASGQIVRGSAAAERFAEPLPAAWALQDPDDWLASAAQAVRSAIGAADPAAVAGIGVDFTSCTVLPARADGTPLSRTALAARPHAWPKLWKHHGAQPQATRITTIARERGEPWLDRYGGIVGLEWSFPKLLEVVDDDPEVADAADVWLEGGDWFVWQLTGAPSLGGDRDGSGLVRSTCQAGYKALWSRSGGYPDATFLDACRPGFGSIAGSLLAAAAFVAPGEAAGELSPAAADLLGLRAGTPVSAAVIDAHAGVPGAGVSATGTLVMVLGTSGCHMIMDPAEHRIAGVAGVVADGILPGAYGYETGQAAVGDAFEWVRRLTGSPDHASLEAAARTVPPGSEGLAAVDWFNGCRTPLMDGHLSGAVLGATLHHGPGHLYRCVLEASACGLAWIVDTLRDGGVAVDRFVATGGLPGQNELFGEIVAAVLGAPVEVPSVEHGSALGAAVLGAAAAERFATVGDAVASMAGAGSAVDAPRVIEPDLAAIEAYRPVLARYHAAADAVRRAALDGVTDAADEVDAHEPVGVAP